MLWQVAIPTALLALALLAAPAAGGIQRHIDSQGVIRISNCGAAQPVKKKPDSDIAASLAPDPGSQGASGPRAAAAAKPVAPLHGPPAPARENSSPAISPGPNQEQNARPAPENRGTAASPETGENGGQLPVSRVAHDRTEAGVAAIPAPLPAASPKTEVSAAGGIRRFRDSQGVLHITNATPERQDDAPRMLLAAENLEPEKGLSEKEGIPDRAVPQDLPVQKASWSPDLSKGAAPPAGAAARNPVPGGAGPIRRYRDSRGVIHINNVEPGVAGSFDLSTAPARAGPEEEAGPPARPRPPPPGGGGARLALQPAAWSGENRLIADPPGRAVSRKAEITTPGGIRRYRDRHGVMHIETVGDPWPQGAPQPPRPIGEGRNLLPAGINAATGPFLAYRADPAAIQAGPTPGRGYRGITAFKDSRGRLTITNAPEAVLGRGPPAATAKALLEPIIQEAARAYGIPATLIRAVIKVESNFVTGAVSPKGAMGLMQLMPGTAAFLGVQEPFDPKENIRGGCRYLRLLLDFFGGSLPLALAGYNAGYQRVVDCGYRVPDIKETQEFLTQVMGWYIAEEKKALLPWT